MAILQPWHLQFAAKFDNDTSQKIARTAEAIIVEELRLGTIPNSASNPDPIEQGLEAFTLTDYAFTIPSDGPVLLLPAGPLTDITSLSVDDVAVNLASIDVGPWTIRLRDGSSFSCGSSVLINGTVGWSDPLAVPRRIKTAADLLAAHVAEWFDENATITQRTDGEQYFNPRRDRVRELIGPLLSPWTRPIIF